MVNVPQYEIKGECPELSDLLDQRKTRSLIDNIQAANITEGEKEFLVAAAGRHNVFNYRNIAEYYAHATPEMQRLMEESALVIIDIDNAIANGYIKMKSDIYKLMNKQEL